ncbi:hypothetical protein [Clostridium folliculivorans]|uniref:hypothetical protein n=1 Tax=Clostridium folliculivorans TaxID=2886038 RepID=UPI0021C2BAEF|nr:hypothetical protein [Clostridium folliculivorans]GKU31655.1 hypothetical protein CFB3_37620 [Clostridium folliculivorans]
MTKFEYYQIAFYESELIKNENRLKSLLKTNIVLSLDNKRLNTENARIKEQLELLQLKSRGFIGKDRRVRCIAILDHNEDYKSQGLLN